MYLSWLECSCLVNLSDLLSFLDYITMKLVNILFLSWPNLLIHQGTLVSDVPCRFPSSAKATKLGKSEATPAKGSLISGKLSPTRSDVNAQTQHEVDLVE